MKEIKDKEIINANNEKVNKGKPKNINK